MCKNQSTRNSLKFTRQHLKAIRGNTAKVVEIIYVSIDRDVHAFERFVCNMPWLAVQYNVRQQLITAFQVKMDNARTLPKIVVLDTSDSQNGHMNNGGIINKDAFPELHLRMNTDSDKKLAEQFPWVVSAGEQAGAGAALCALMYCSIQWAVGRQQIDLKYWLVKGVRKSLHIWTLKSLHSLLSPVKW